MAIDQTNIIDFTAVTPDQNEFQLIISDHLEWAIDEDFDKEHMYLLQEKVNSYLGFIESGEIYKSCPQAKDKKLKIRLIAKYDMNISGKAFYKKIEEALLSSGYIITFEKFNA